MLTLHLTLDKGQVTVRANKLQSHSFAIRDLDNTDLKNFVNDPKPYGGKLFEALFMDGSSARKAFDELSKQTEPTIVLVLESSELDGITWEYAYHDNAYIVEDFAFMRALPEKERPYANGRLSKSVERVPLLFIPANPLVDLNGEPMRELDIESEWREMTQHIGKSNAPFDLIELRPATPAALQSIMARFQNGMIAHFSGHGAATTNGAFLLFENENGSSNPLEAREFVREVKDQAWIGFLSACQSAVAKKTEYSNLARELVKAGVPFALGMQFNLPDPFAPNISGQFYNYLSQGHAVPEAARQARRAVKRENEFYVGMIALYAAHPDETGKIGWTDSGARTLSAFAAADVSDLPTPSGFIGRQRELMNIGTSLFGRNKTNTVTLHGAGGIGKTALMRQALLRFAPSFESALAIALDPLPSLESVLGRLERFLNLPSPCSNDTKEREKMVHKSVTSKSTLLGLDNFETLIHARDNGSNEEKKTAKSLYAFFKSLAAEGMTLCVTSREKTSLPSETIQEIHGLEDEVGGKLFQNTVSTRKDALTEVGLKKISVVVGGHPLALRLLAPIFEEQAGVTLEQFIDKTQTFLPKASDHWSEQDRHENLEQCFGFSIKHLSSIKNGEELEKALIQLSVFLAYFYDYTAFPLITKVVDGDEYDDEYNVQKPFINSMLHTLWERGLLERIIIEEPNENFYMYRLHPTLRIYLTGRVINQGAINKAYLMSENRLTELLYQKIQTEPLLSRIASYSIPDMMYAVDAQENETKSEYGLRLSKTLIHIGMFDEALQILDETCRISAKINYLHNQAGSIKVIASIHRLTGKIGSAKKLLQESILLFDELDDVNGKISANLEIAAIELMEDNPNAALETLGQVEGLLSNADNFDLKVNFCYQKAQIQQKLGNLDAATDLYNTLLGDVEKTGNLNEKAVFLGELAKIYMARGDYINSLHYNHEKLEITSQLKNKREQALALHEIASIQLYLGNLDDAIGLFYQSLEIRKDLGDFLGQSDVLHQLGSVLSRQNKFNEAMAHFQESLDILEKLNIQQGKSSTYSMMADTEISRKNLNEGMWYAQKALEVAEQHGNLEDMANALFAIAKCFSEQGNTSQALTSYDKTIDLYDKLNNLSKKAIVLKQIAELYLEHGDIKKTMELYKSAAEAYENSGNIYGLGVTLNDMAIAYVSYFSDYQSALPCLAQALTLFEEVGSEPSIYNAKNTIIAIRQALGEKEFNQLWAAKMDAQQPDWLSSLGKTDGSTHSKRRSISPEQFISEALRAVREERPEAEQYYRIAIEISQDPNQPRESRRLGEIIQSIMTDSEFSFAGLPTNWVKAIKKELQQFVEQSQQEEGMTLGKFIMGAIQSSRGNYPDTDQYFKMAQKMASDVNAPDELQLLGMVLQNIMIDEENVDLSILPNELREMVEKALRG